MHCPRYQEASLMRLATFFTKGYKSKSTCFMRTIRSFEDNVAGPYPRDVEGEDSMEEFRKKHQSYKMASLRSRMEYIDSTLSPDLQRTVN